MPPRSAEVPDRLEVEPKCSRSSQCLRQARTTAKLSILRLWRRGMGITFATETSIVALPGADRRYYEGHYWLWHQRAVRRDSRAASAARKKSRLACR